MLNKKELKQKVFSEADTIEMIVRKPYVCVEVMFNYNGTEFTGYGFSKWNTLDMAIVGRAKKFIKRLDGDDKDDDFMLSSDLLDQCKHILSKLNWSKSRGIEIAKGRAMMDVVEQILDLEHSIQVKQAVAEAHIIKPPELVTLRHLKN